MINAMLPPRRVLKIHLQNMFVSNTWWCEEHGVALLKESWGANPWLLILQLLKNPNQNLKTVLWKCTAHTCPKWTVIGLRSSRSLGSLTSASGDGTVFGSGSSAEEGQPFSAMSCREKEGLGLALGSQPFVLSPHPHKPGGLLRTLSRLSKADSRERWRK